MIDMENAVARALVQLNYAHNKLRKMHKQGHPKQQARAYVNTRNGEFVIVFEAAGHAGKNFRAPLWVEAKPK